MTTATATAAATDAEAFAARFPGIDPQTKPLPIWFFAFEGLLAGAYDLSKIAPALGPALIGLVALNFAVSFTVLGKRRKLLRQVLKNARTRWLAVGLIGLRFGIHAVLGLLGTLMAGATGHALLAVIMCATTMTMLWFDQRVIFRALGLSTVR